MVIIHEEVDGVGKIFGQQIPRCFAWAMVSWQPPFLPLTERPIEIPVAHAVVHSFYFRCVDGHPHHFIIYGRHQQVAFKQLVSRMKAVFASHPSARPGIESRQLFAQLIGFGDRHIDDLQALQVGNAESLSGFHDLYQPCGGRHDSFEYLFHQNRNGCYARLRVTLIHQV